jgi:signal transduction histidine kinase
VNAVRHTPAEARVWLRVRAVPEGALLQVDDDGPGIDPERSQAIFDRHDGATSGIGLALAQTLVDADGGRLLDALDEAELDPESIARLDEHAHRLEVIH